MWKFLQVVSQIPQSSRRNEALHRNTRHNWDSLGTSKGVQSFLLETHNSFTSLPSSFSSAHNLSFSLHYSFTPPSYLFSQSRSLTYVCLPHPHFLFLPTFMQSETTYIPWKSSGDELSHPVY